MFTLLSVGLTSSKSPAPASQWRPCGHSVRRPQAWRGPCDWRRCTYERECVRRPRRAWCVLMLCWEKSEFVENYCVDAVLAFTDPHPPCASRGQKTTFSKLIRDACHRWCAAKCRYNRAAKILDLKRSHRNTSPQSLIDISVRSPDFVLATFQPETPPPSLISRASAMATFYLVCCCRCILYFHIAVSGRMRWHHWCALPPSLVSRVQFSLTLYIFSIYLCVCLSPGVHDGTDDARTRCSLKKVNGSMGFKGWCKRPSLSVVVHSSHTLYFSLLLSVHSVYSSLCP